MQTQQTGKRVMVTMPDELYALFRARVAQEQSDRHVSDAEVARALIRSALAKDNACPADK